MNAGSAISTHNALFPPYQLSEAFSLAWECSLEVAHVLRLPYIFILTPMSQARSLKRGTSLENAESSSKIDLDPNNATGTSTAALRGKFGSYNG
jgi:hypothetical protein